MYKAAIVDVSIRDELLMLALLTLGKIWRKWFFPKCGSGRCAGCCIDLHEVMMYEVNVYILICL